LLRVLPCGWTTLLSGRQKRTHAPRGSALSRMVEEYLQSVGEQERHGVRESPVLYEVSGVLSGMHDATRLRTGCRKHLAAKYW
jgi:hypothetical protein